jgi:hypothetical protein
MKKQLSKPNALKVFNDNKAAAYKKAGGAMNTYKKSLKKAQAGGLQRQGPLQEKSSKMLDARFPSTASVKIPYASNEAHSVGYAPMFEGDLSSNAYKEGLYRKSDERRMRNDPAFNDGYYKKGGSTKMAVGGTKDSDCWPGKPGCGAERARRVNKRRRFWNSDTGKTVKKVGAGVAAAGAGAAAYAKNLFGAKDAVKGLMEQKKGGTVKRKK